jgi:UDP-3-O-[3-hydroxymyristoyl] glucosamine N-acyltransferase
VLYPGVRLGNRVVLHGNCVIGADGFGYARDGARYEKLPQVGTVQLEDDVEIGAGSTVDRGALGVTRIGRGSKLDNLVHVGHNCDFGEDVAVAGFSAFSGSTTLGDRVQIGGHTVSQGHLRVAADVRVGGASVIHDDLAEAGDYLGYPLQHKRQWVRTLHAIDSLLALQQEVRELKKKLGS